MSNFLLKMLELSDEVSKAYTSTKKTTACMETSMRELFSSGISAEEFKKMYNMCSYNFANKRQDIKILKNNDILGVYVLYNKSKNTYFIGRSNRVFRKVDRQFRGFENKEVFKLFSDGDEYWVKIIPFRKDEYVSLEELEKNVKEKYEGRSDAGNSVASEKENTEQVNNKAQSLNKNEIVTSIPDKELKKKRRRAFWLHGKRIEISYDTTELVGKNADVVYSFLKNVGFKRIELIPLKKIDGIIKKEVREVKNIEVDGVSFFQKKDTFPYDAEIIITYYEKKEICMPHSYKYYVKRNYCDVCNELKNLGFVNIKCIKQNDLIIGCLKKENNVARISISGNINFSKKKVFIYDECIEIWFHAFR